MLVRQHQRVFGRLQPPHRPSEQAVQPVVVLLLQRQLRLLLPQPLLQLQLLQLLRFVLHLRHAFASALSGGGASLQRAQHTNLQRVQLRVFIAQLLLQSADHHRNLSHHAS